MYTLLHTESSGGQTLPPKETGIKCYLVAWNYRLTLSTRSQMKQINLAGLTKAFRLRLWWVISTMIESKLIYPSILIILGWILRGMDFSCFPLPSATMCTPQKAALKMCFRRLQPEGGGNSGNSETSPPSSISGKWPLFMYEIVWLQPFVVCIMQSDLILSPQKKILPSSRGCPLENFSLNFSQ